MYQRDFFLHLSLFDRILSSVTEPFTVESHEKARKDVHSDALRGSFTQR
jgi:hypothetical protein